MSDMKLQTARKLVAEGHYASARTRLLTIEHPDAHVLLAKLDNNVSSAARAKRQKSVALLIVGTILILFTHGPLLLAIYGQNTNTIPFVYPTATGELPPVPVKLAKTEMDKLRAKCLDAATSTLTQQLFYNVLPTKIKSDDFRGIGSIAKLFMGEDCNRNEAFPVMWEIYVEKSGMALKSIIDEPLAWSQFLVGWEDTKPIYTNQTGTTVPSPTLAKLGSRP